MFFFWFSIKNNSIEINQDHYLKLFAHFFSNFLERFFKLRCFCFEKLIYFNKLWVQIELIANFLHRIVLFYAPICLNKLCSSCKLRKQSYIKWLQIKICILINLYLFHLFIQLCYLFICYSFQTILSLLCRELTFLLNLQR